MSIYVYIAKQYFIKNHDITDFVSMPFVNIFDCHVPTLTSLLRPL